MKEFFKNLWRLTRPLSSVKNVALVLVAFYFSSQAFNLPKIILGTLFLSLVSSAVYAYNTINDVKIDRENKNKKHYSQAAEYFGNKKSYVIILLFLLAALAGSLLFNVYFFAALLILFLNGFLYSCKYTRFKEKPVLDVFFGALTPFLLRFSAAWFVFQISVPPLLPLIFLVCAKTGGYILYKELDRPYLAKLNIKNSTTYFGYESKIIASIILFLISFLSFLLLCFNSLFNFNPELWGKMPLYFLFLIILAIPPLIIIYLMNILKIYTKVNEFRVLGYYYWIVIIIFILFIV